MRSYKDTGLIFKQVNINEADKIVSILSKYHGRIDAIVKGARKIKSRKGSNIDIMTLCKYHIAKGKNLDIIIEVELLDQYSVLKENLKLTFKLFYICELLDKLFKVGEKDIELFQLTIELLESLKTSKSELPLYSFELKLLSNLGFEANLDSCINCNRELSEKEKRYMTRYSIGFLCVNEKHDLDKTFSNTALKVMKFLKNRSIKDTAMISSNEDLENEIKAATKLWLENVVENEIKSGKYL